MRGFIAKFPPWSLTVVTLALLLWLTLAPKPLGERPPELFPGADKIAHGIMFGGQLLMILVDRLRSKDWTRPGYGFITLATSTVILLGIVIEELQGAMDIGRSYDVKDIYADATGTIIVAAMWIVWRRKRGKKCA